MPAAPWTNSPTGRPVSSPIRCDELLGEVGQQRVGRVVEDHARRPERGNLLRPLDERVDLARRARRCRRGRRGTPCRLPRSPRLPPGGSRRRSAGRGAGRRRSRCRPRTTTKRRTMSADTGREPTRNRPRSARPRGVVVRASIARIRSHGLSTARRTAESKTPPPETSRYAKPARSRISAIRRTSPVGSFPASGSCDSRRMVVSTISGIAKVDLSVAGRRR